MTFCHPPSPPFHLLFTSFSPRASHESSFASEPTVLTCKACGSFALRSALPSSALILNLTAHWPHRPSALCWPHSSLPRLPRALSTLAGSGQAFLDNALPRVHPPSQSVSCLFPGAFRTRFPAINPGQDCAPHSSHTNTQLRPPSQPPPSFVGHLVDRARRAAHPGRRAPGPAELGRVREHTPLQAPSRPG